MSSVCRVIFLILNVWHVAFLLVKKREVWSIGIIGHMIMNIKLLHTIVWLALDCCICLYKYWAIEISAKLFPLEMKSQQNERKKIHNQYWFIYLICTIPFLQWESSSFNRLWWVHVLFNCTCFIDVLYKFDQDIISDNWLTIWLKTDNNLQHKKRHSGLYYDHSIHNA